ncbi:Hexosaminidase D [Hypsibius exemplaris]|uniref:beta-N-acetylhexosaminidase n=1 Tax=Hypsibius exemplaris TaxID=2072580 RepID=A0A9X6NP34_HYPEX|nr:Hexosaminidase D [Hypsibius exemplaris]
MGATGLLMEYEDMFPFTGELKVVNAKNGYSKEDVKTILRLANESGLYVIPLVQTFGHLEFVLKHKEFRHLREVDKFPQAVCPTRNGTFSLVQELIAQTMELHPEAKYLHIGADEVFHIGRCNVCSRIGMKLGPGFLGVQAAKHQIFLAYVSQVLQHIRRTYPAVKPIMWDDMFRTMSAREIETGLGELTQYVEPMIWSYFSDWRHHLPQYGDLYKDVFPNIWGATAFKGSSGETAQIPNIKTQAMIHTSWISSLRENGHKMKNFRGIALTGWSRFDHFNPLCELFPVALPSLAVSMQILQDNEMNLEGVQEAAKNLNCQPDRPATLAFLEFDPNLDEFNNCSFPGTEVYRSVHAVMDLLVRRIEPHLKELESNFPVYQLHELYVQASRLDEHLRWITRHEKILANFMEEIKAAFKLVFDEYTLNEWIAANVVPVWTKLEAWKVVLTNTSLVEEWSSRPLNIPPFSVPIALPIGVTDTTTRLSHSSKVVPYKNNFPEQTTVPSGV